ncbi:unnamed protein product [Hermetia illucens]|uniref:FLYWCH-type domain-containing protein n=1 Tax=Hermetia illucens TaxID=343691 RepID=A0A7R8UNR9_HERIL|nr:unnamed protein product [Hermetia illucens]
MKEYLYRNDLYKSLMVASKIALGKQSNYDIIYDCDLTAKPIKGGIDFLGYKYHKSGVVKNGVIYYRCAKIRTLQCPATLQVEGDIYRTNKKEHNHPPKIKVDAFVGKKLSYNGYYFYRHGKTMNKIHWRCSTLSCSVRLHTNYSGKFISIRGEHKHLPKEDNR